MLNNSYKDELEAYDNLPPTLRARIRDARVWISAAFTCRFLAKNGEDATLAAMDAAERAALGKGQTA
jgi:hypothetical protein